MARRKYGEAHVRIYGHELRTPAWQTMSPDAKALLVEMRALYNGRENRIHMSVREAMRRLGIGQRRAQKALEALLERGWVRVVERGAFTRKTRHASVYALEHEPLENRDGATAPKTFMKWTPQKNTVAATTTDGSCHDYRHPGERPKKGSNGSRHDYRKANFEESTVAATATQISYQGVPVK